MLYNQLIRGLYLLMIFLAGVELMGIE